MSGANSPTEVLKLSLQPILSTNNLVRNIEEILVHAENFERHDKVLN